MQILITFYLAFPACIPGILYLRGLEAEIRDNHKIAKKYYRESISQANKSKQSMEQWSE